MRRGFIENLLPYYTQQKNKQTGIFHVQKFVDYLSDGHIEQVLQEMRSFFADMPYELSDESERHYQAVLYVIFTLIGCYTEAEYHTAVGRVDLVVKTPDYIYVMEFKFNGTAEDAMAQIEEKQYAAPFATDRRKVVKVAVNFSAETRNIDRWLIV